MQAAPPVPLQPTLVEGPVLVAPKTKGVTGKVQLSPVDEGKGKGWLSQCGLEEGPWG